ncbi:hypothetical protein K466DRAFT_647371 [Polyporus arcularius HHB13444]|uniref:Uncharacterized protein n=2 Tax=Polyporaceae TaxID=5317 RepID=A0A5C3P3M7_9APHY|nr:hypothetical protein OH76DRAFT_1476824 [Polyporus brumalis]TFK84081.1 hypothetical protein K466DRAFT_647371 [Polyporus arcularius HHB13444]
MSNTSDAYPEFFRRRTLGRAPSPPTWACYEQIPYEDDYSDSASDNNSCSEDEEDYDHVGSDGDGRISSNDPRSSQIDGDMEIDEGDEPMSADKVAELKKDIKGKQRAVEHYESPKREHRKKQRQPVFTLRPILTIQKSQGFVWNQDLFVPPYIKDRYVASTSPSNSHGFVSSSVSSTNSSMMEYEVEVVEIRVREGELNDIIP